MTSLKELEKLYYKAIQAAKLDEPTGENPGPLGYFTEDFSRWARKLDIFTLGEGAADFALKQHEEIVKEFGEYRRDLAGRLSKCFTFSGVSLPGQLKDIGSCWDGSKVGAVNEMDSLYVIHGDHFVIQEHTQAVYQVFLKIDSTLLEIKPRAIRDQFTQKYSQLVSEMKLPDCLEHGGYKASRRKRDTPENTKSSYSGVRYNGPAATSQFLAKDKSLLTWDMTPAIVLPLDIQTQDALRQSMQAIIADNPDKMFPPSDVHLIPDIVENVWRRSTAQMEADVLRVLSKEGPMKKSLSFCKVLSNRLKQWHDRFEASDIANLDIVNELRQKLEMHGNGKAPEGLDEFEEMMRFGHIWLPYETKEEFNEDSKSSISINNAAIKHILFKAAFERKGAFGSERNMHVVQELIKEVFEKLGNANVYSTEHAFLPGIRISHFSVSPTVASKKQRLARDVCQQCCTLVQEAMTGPTCTCEIDMLAAELNKNFSTPRELRCGEYSFKLRMNHRQHPVYDNNIHHLFALFTSLHCGCGGVVYLMTDDAENVTQEVFEVYKERLLALIGTKLPRLPLLPNMIQVSLLLGTQRSWAALLLKKSYDTLKYPPVETKGIWKPLTFEIDLFGQIHTKNVSDTHIHDHRVVESASVSPVYGLASSITNNQENIPHHTMSETASTFATAQVPISKGSGLTVIPKVDFSSCQRLDWTDNTKDWRKYVNIKELKADDIMVPCPMWEPMQPMNIIPNEQSIRYLFDCENDVAEVLSTVDTKEPGCAVVCRTWRFHISDVNITDDLPPGHICDILTVTDTGRLSFWVVVSSLDDDKFHSQMDYLMTTGRMLKYQIVQKGKSDDLSNLWIECRLLPLTASHSTEKAVKRRLSESQNIQAHLCHLFKDGVDFQLLQRALTTLILTKQSPLKRCISEHTSITLSVQQAEVLMHKAKVSYITGPAGSGKSYTGAFLHNMYGRERSVYICTTNAFLEYLKFSGCTGILVLGDQDLLREIKSGTFENKICIVIDDCHKFTCTRNSMKKLFQVLKKNRDLSLFVFADNDYQSFDRKRQQAMQDCILELTRSVLKDMPQICHLTDIYRNTRKVVSFLQAAIQDVRGGQNIIECANMENGEGVECIPMYCFASYLHTLFLFENYRQSEVAILFDSAFTPFIQEFKLSIAEHFSEVTFQSADVFPRTGVIVDSVDSFFGLDASVCVFILSNTEKKSVHPLRRIFRGRKAKCEMNMYNPRYEVFLASRAVYKAVFVVEELHDDLVHHMKFDHFPFHAPVEFQHLRKARQHWIQHGNWLLGFCFDDSKIYCVEERLKNETYCLAVYDIGGAENGSLSLLDTVLVRNVRLKYCRPSIDGSHQVYVPCQESGVRVFRYQDGRLLPVRDPLKCVKDAWSICVNTADTVFVGDWNTKPVCLVNASKDTVIRRLERPIQVWATPYHVSVVGDTVLVCYGDNTLVTYRRDSSTPGQVLQTPEGVKEVTSITTDSHSSSFIITDNHSVFVLDEKFLWHRVYTGAGGLVVCIVVQSQLWLGYRNGKIAVLTSQ